MITATHSDQSAQIDRPSIEKLDPKTVPATLERSDEEFEKTFHKCFNRAALGNAAQLPELLRETRGSGISDEEVRLKLEESQIDLSQGIFDDEGYLIWGSQDNRLCVTCETWNTKATVASANELFTELPRSNPLGAALVCAVGTDFDIDQIELGYLWKTFESQGFSFPEFHRAVGELVACGRACLLEAIADGKTACHLELINDYSLNECVPITVAMEAIAQPDSAATDC